MKKILRTKYEKYQSEIRSLCLQLGLVEHNNVLLLNFVQNMILRLSMAK